MDTMSEDKALLSPADLDRLRKALEVIHHARSNDVSYAQACKALSIPSSTFYNWLKQGVLEPYLQQELKTMSQVVAATVVDGIPAMLTHQMRIATGKKGNPRDATASFLALMKLAGLDHPGDLVRSERETVETFLDRYKPRKVTIEFEHDGAPPDAERDGEATPLELPDLPDDDDVVDGEVL